MIYKILVEVDASRMLGIVQAGLAVDTPKRDPLIARNLEAWQYIGIIGLAVGLIVLVRIFSPRVEHAILFAIFLSVILIVFFFTG